MNQPRRRQRHSRRRNGGDKRHADLWRPVPQPPAPGRIVPASDPAALLRSLGDPPLPGQGAAEHYLAAVAERAAGLATALAATAGLLAEPNSD